MLLILEELDWLPKRNPYVLPTSASVSSLGGTYTKQSKLPGTCTKTVSDLSL